MIRSLLHKLMYCLADTFRISLTTLCVYYYYYYLFIFTSLQSMVLGTRTVVTEIIEDLVRTWKVILV